MSLSRAGSDWLQAQMVLDDLTGLALLLRFFVLLVLATAVGCGKSDLRPIPGTTVRVSESSIVGTAGGGGDANDLSIQIFTNPDLCVEQVGVENLGLCLPFVDRATGQVRLAFRMQIGDTAWPMPLTADDLQVFHKGRAVFHDQPPAGRVVLIPHDPVPTPQLYILLIDISGSMQIVDAGSNRNRMEKIRAALLREDVIDAFFPVGAENVKTGVVPLVFSSGDPKPLAEKWVVYNRAAYKEAIATKLGIGRGYTHLYHGVGYAASVLPGIPEVKEAIQTNGMAPTIIAMTDGFNNEDDLRRGSKDVCGDNAPRLETLVKQLSNVRQESNVRERSTVFTVGLGRKAWPMVSAPAAGSDANTLLTVQANVLCGRFAKEIIDGGVLERRGVDNMALEWIANAGGGKTYVKKDTKGLAEAFKDAAATRYRWFELRYQVDPTYLRRRFKTNIRLASMLNVESAIHVHPSGWLDAPPGQLDKNGWASATPISRTTVVILPILGAVLSLSYLPAALHNVRRALFNRVGRKKKK